jgi:hypothetical protein
VTCPPPATRTRFNGNPPNPIVTAASQHSSRVHIQPTPVGHVGPSSLAGFRPAQNGDRQQHRTNAAGNPNNSRWGNRGQAFPCPQRPPVPPQRHGAIANQAATGPLFGLPTNLIQNYANMSVPPPPEWQPYLRDLVISLGYRRATSVWPRLARCRLGTFSENVRREQDAFMLWCRETVIGFER